MLSEQRRFLELLTLTLCHRAGAQESFSPGQADPCWSRALAAVGTALILGQGNTPSIVHIFTTGDQLIVTNLGNGNGLLAELTLTAVPEPSTFVGLFALLVGGFFYRRRLLRVANRQV